MKCGIESCLRTTVLVLIGAIALIYAHQAVAYTTCGTGKVLWVKSNLDSLNGGHFGFALQLSNSTQTENHFFSSETIEGSARARALHDVVLLAAATGATVTVFTGHSSCVANSPRDGDDYIPDLLDVRFGS